MRKLGRIGGTSFVTRLQGVSVKQLRSWIGLRTGSINRFLSLTFNKLLARENWADMANFNMQLHGHLVSVMERVSKLSEVGLDARRQLNHKYGPRNPLRNIQLLERLLAPSQVGYSDVVASMERLEQELRVIRQGFGDDVQNLWKSIHMVCIQKICPQILRDHLAVQASSIDSSEHRLTIEKFRQAKVHGSGATPMDVDALAKTKGGKRGRQFKEVSRQLFLVWRVWSHDGRLPKEGSWETAGSQVTARTRSEAEGQQAKVAKARREHRPLIGQMVRKLSRLLSWERIDLTIDSGCAACALPVGVASAVGMQELNRTPQEYTAANAEKFESLGSRL